MVVSTFFAFCCIRSCLYYFFFLFISWQHTWSSCFQGCCSSNTVTRIWLRPCGVKFMPLKMFLSVIIWLHLHFLSNVVFLLLNWSFPTTNTAFLVTNVAFLVTKIALYRILFNSEQTVRTLYWTCGDTAVQTIFYRTRNKNMFWKRLWTKRVQIYKTEKWNILAALT